MTGIDEVAQVVFVRKRLVEVQYLRATITDEQRQEFATLVDDTVRRIESGLFLPPTGVDIRYKTVAGTKCPIELNLLGGTRAPNANAAFLGEAFKQLGALLQHSIPGVVARVGQAHVLAQSPLLEQHVAGSSRRKRAATACSKARPKSMAVRVSFSCQPSR